MIALKAAISAGKTVGKKALKTAVKQGVPLLKEGIKQGITEATKYGTEASIKGINSLTQKAINIGVPPSIAEDISTVEKGDIKAAEKIGQTATQKLHTGINSVTHKYTETVGVKRKRGPLKKSRKSPGPSRKK